MSTLEQDPETTEDAVSGSLLDVLHRKRDEIARREQREERKPVPMWEGALRIVYRYPDGGADRIVAAVERAQAGGRAFDANCDVLIACAHDVQGRVPDGDWQSLDPGRPTRFTKRLAELLRIEVPEDAKSPARFIARHVFSPQAAQTGVFEGDISLMVQAGELIRWLQGSDAAADEGLRGE